MWTASEASRTPKASTANSSPPSRATVSEGRMSFSSRRAIATSRRSPTEWPRLSLTVLKRSRSRNSTAKVPLWPRCSAESAIPRRSRKRLRLARAVSPSWKASWTSCSSARLRAEMSLIEPAIRITRPRPSRTSAPRVATHSAEPSRQRMRCSRATWESPAAAAAAKAARSRSRSPSATQANQLSGRPSSSSAPRPTIARQRSERKTCPRTRSQSQMPSLAP